VVLFPKWMEGIIHTMLLYITIGRVDDNAFGKLSDDKLVKETGLNELDIAAVVLYCRLPKLAWTWYAASLGLQRWFSTGNPRGGPVRWR